MFQDVDVNIQVQMYQNFDVNASQSDFFFLLIIIIDKEQNRFIIDTKKTESYLNFLKIILRIISYPPHMSSNSIEFSEHIDQQ